MKKTLTISLLAMALLLSANTQAQQMVKDITPGANYDGPFDLTNVNGTLFLTVPLFPDGQELWKSNGTVMGTVLVKAINPGATTPYSNLPLNVNGTLFFSAYDGSGLELWKSDGTVPGTVMLMDIYPGTNGSDPKDIINLNGTLFFSAKDGSNGNAWNLWKSDGTVNGTFAVMPPGTVNSPWRKTIVGNTFYFYGNDLNQNVATNTGGELWKSDGTASGTMLVKDINTVNAGNSSYPYNLTKVGNKLFFSATIDNNVGSELWKSDGTQSGTVMVKDINPGTYASGVPADAYFKEFNNNLIFFGNNGTTGSELWKSDGTAGGTMLVKDINPGATGSVVKGFTELNGMLYFFANDGTHGKELWKTDGTLGGTSMVKDIYPGSFGCSNDPEIIVFNNKLYLSAGNGISGSELWESDGTEAGTLLVRDIRPGTNSSEPFGFMVSNNVLYFSANDGIHGKELWRYPSLPSGINETTVSINPLIYPNPSANTLSIESQISKGSYQLHDMAGKLLESGSVTSTKFTLDISPFRNGVYFITISNGEESVRNKLIKN